MKKSNINWNHYRSFVALYETKHYPTAAEMVGISRSTIGQNVQELGRQLGVRLFVPDKKRQGVEPTSEAIARYPAVKAAVDMLIECEEHNQNFTEQTHAVIRMAIPSALASFHFADYIAWFRGQFPNVNFVFCRKDSIDLLVTKKIDLAIEVKKYVSDRDFKIVDLFDEKIIFVATKEFLVDEKIENEISISELQSLPIVAQKDILSLFNDGSGMDVSPVVVAVSTEQVYSLVKRNCGIGMCWGKALDTQRCAADGVVELAVSGLDLVERFAVAYNKSALTKASEVFIDGLKRFYDKKFS